MENVRVELTDEIIKKDLKKFGIIGIVIGALLTILSLIFLLLHLNISNSQDGTSFTLIFTGALGLPILIFSLIKRKIITNMKFEVVIAEFIGIKYIDTGDDASRYAVFKYKEKLYSVRYSIIKSLKIPLELKSTDYYLIKPIKDKIYYEYKGAGVKQSWHRAYKYYPKVMYYYMKIE